MNIRGFLSLLAKYKEGRLSGEKKELMDRWYEVMSNSQIDNTNDIREVSERIWNKITAKTDGSDEGQKLMWEPQSRTWKYAVWRIASIFLFAAVGAYFYFLSDSGDRVTATLENMNISEWVTVINENSSEQMKLLPDGSEVILEPGSKLTYPAEFDDNSRVVYLEGDGYFSVMRDERKPFRVFAGNVQVNVLGTSFKIKNIHGDDATEVAVISGKVLVEKAWHRKPNMHTPGENRVVLTPNQKVTFFKDSDHYVTGLVEYPVLVDKSETFEKPGVFIFDEIPLKMILEKLEKAYGVSITVSNDKILDCLITADLSTDNLYGKIEIISAIINGKYEVTGNTVLLTNCTCSVFDK